MPAERLVQVAGLQAFAMAPGTWHWAGFPTARTEAVFLVVFAAGTEGADLEFTDLDGPRAVRT